MIVNAHRMAKPSELRGIPLWGFVRDVCGTGSTYACEICKECGWDAHQPAKDKLMAWPLDPAPLSPNCSVT